MSFASEAFKRFIVAVGSLTTLLLVLSVLAFWYKSSGIFGTASFDKRSWTASISNEEQATCYRGGMAKDVRDNVLLRQMTREDVIALLGQPSGNFTEQEYQYVLGMCSGFGIDYDNLHVYFDERGKFSYAQIIQH